MLKWLGGCLAVVIVLAVGGMWFAMRMVRQSMSPDGSIRVAIHAPPSRVFASLAHGDSSATYMAQGNTVSTSRRGMFQPGDSIRVQTRGALGLKPEPMIWEVRQIVPDQLVVVDIMDPKGRGIIATRRDSLVAQNDSTIVVSKLISSVSTSRGTSVPDSIGTSTAAEMMLSMMRMQSKLELESLKARIEGPLKPRQ